MKIWMYVFITKLIFWISGISKIIHWWLWKKRLELHLLMTEDEHEQAIKLRNDWEEAHLKSITR